MEIPFLESVPEPAPTPAVSLNQRIQEVIPDRSGPYYFYSPGEQIAVHDDAFGFPYFNPGLVQPMGDEERWSTQHIEYAPRTRLTRDPFTLRDTEMEWAYRIPASANRLSAIAKYGPGMNGFPPGESNHGLVEITAFSERQQRDVGIVPFNRKISPVMFDFKRVPKDLQAAVDEKGGLAVRKEFVLEAEEYFKSDSFLNIATRELQAMYQRAIDEIMDGFSRYHYFATEYLDASDKAIRNGDRNRYDDRDYRMMWLLKREPADTALSRALTQNSGGLTADQLSAVLEKIVPQQQANQMSPEFIASIVAATVSALNQQKEQITVETVDPNESAVDRKMRLAREEHERNKKR